MKHTTESVKKIQTIAWILYISGIVVGIGLRGFLSYASVFIGLLLVVSATLVLRKANKIRKSLEPAN